MSRRGARSRHALCAALALVLAVAGARRAIAEEAAPLRLRYGWSAGEIWRASLEIERETHLGGDVRRDRGMARFEYAVEPGAAKDALRLEARMLSQETDAGAAPLDLSPIVFHAEIDARGRLRGVDFSVAEALPPVAAGEAVDPLAHRQVLRQLAAAWRGSVFWFPELPERSLAPGESFAVGDERDLGDAEPGVAMRVHSTRTYRLLAVADGVARFRVEDDSRVEAGAGTSAVTSRQKAGGEALFDLGLGMWTRQQLVSSERASYAGAPEGVGPGEATSRSVTTIEMQRASAAPPRR